MADSIHASNKAPDGFHEIPEKEFVQNTPFFHHAPERREFKQILGVGPTVLSVWLYSYWDGTGVGISDDYWKGRVRYFRWGCPHDYRPMAEAERIERKIPHWGNCWHVEKCTTCGHVRSYDSSD